MKISAITVWHYPFSHIVIVWWCVSGLEAQSWFLIGYTCVWSLFFDCTIHGHTCVPLNTTLRTSPLTQCYCFTCIHPKRQCLLVHVWWESTNEDTTHTKSRSFKRLLQTCKTVPKQACQLHSFTSDKNILSIRFQHVRVCHEPLTQEDFLACCTDRRLDMASKLSQADFDLCQPGK